MKKIINILIISLFGLSTISCQTNSEKKTNNKKMKKYDIVAYSCSPRFYPNEIVSGYFYMEDGYSLYIPKGAPQHLGWGLSGSLHVTGPDLKAIPVEVEITWLSFVEKKFYTGRFKLDKELIAEYFSKGYKDRNNKHEDFNSAMVGMAPGGVVVVWIGGPDYQVEVGRYQATETHKVTKNDLIPYASISLEQYIEEVLKEDLEKSHQNKEFMEHIPFGLWDKYRKRYTWKPTILFDSQGKLVNMYINYYNGENIMATAENPEIADYRERAIPKYFILNWEDEKGNEYGADIYLGNVYGSTDKVYKEMEEEIFNAFKTIFSDKEQKAELIFKIDKYNSHIQVFLKSKTDSVEIKKAKIEVYPIT